MTAPEEEIEESWADIREPLIPRMEDAALTDFVLAFCDGRVFTSAQVKNDSLLCMIFMPMLFVEMSERTLKRIGLVWEYTSAAGPRGINGYPIFTTCHIMRLEDWERARVAIKREMDRRESSKKTLLEGI